MVGLVTSSDPFPEAQSLASVIARMDDSIVSVVHAARSSHERASPMTSIKVLAGRDVITEQIGALRFHIGLQTFFQTNTTQAERMLRMVETAVKAQGQDGTGPNLILDVFCGVGFFTLGLARHARTVVGIELLESSINTARKNAKLNQIDNVLFYSGDARRTIPDILEQHGTPDIIVLDPPRSGAGGKVIRRLARAKPKRIVYVSCNPVTSENSSPSATKSTGFNQLTCSHRPTMSKQSSRSKDVRTTLPPQGNATVMLRASLPSVTEKVTMSKLASP